MPLASLSSDTGSHKVALAGRPQNCDFLSQTIAEAIALHFEIEAGLQIEPEAVGCAKVASEPQCSIGRDRALPQNDLVNSTRRNADILREAILRDSQSLEKISQEHFARVNRRELARGHSYTSLVIVNDLDVVCIGAVPSKAYPPLIIHSNAVLPLPVTTELLQTIPWRNPEILKCFRRVYSYEFAKHHAPQIGRESPDGLSGKQALGIAIPEGLDHRL